MKLILHSYTLRRYPLRHVFAVARRYGWEGIELTHVHYRRERVEEELAAAVALGAQYGVSVHCLGYGGDGVGWVGDDDETSERSLQLAERAIDTAARHGISLLNGWSGFLVRDPHEWRQNGSAIAEHRHYERAAKGYRRLGEYARERGVTVAVEVHPNTPHDTVASNVRLLDLVALPNVVTTADPGNSYIISEADGDPAVLDLLGSRLKYFHLKNLVPKGGVADFNVDTADGVLDNYAWINKVNALGVPAIAVEYCGTGDPHPPLARAQGYVRDCIALAAELGSRDR